MKKLLFLGSRWASRHRKLAVAAIVLVHLICSTAAALVGISLFSTGRELPEWAVLAALFALGLAFFSFPKKRFAFESRRERARRWSLERASHGLIFGVLMVGFVVFGNRLYVNSFEEKTLAQRTAFSIVGGADDAGKGADFVEKTMKKPFFARKLTTPNKAFSKKIVEKMRAAEAEGRSGRGFFTAFLVCLLGGFLMMILGCNLSCSEDSVFGGVLLLIGLLSIIASFVFLILGIVNAAGPAPNREPRPPREPRPKGWNLPDAVKD